MSIADELARLEELRRSGALSAAEFARAKEAVLAGGTAAGGSLGKHLSGQLAEVKHQNELARLDREWEREREQYMIYSRYGRAHVPTTGMGVGTAVIGGAAGLLWTVFAVAVVGQAPDVGPFVVVKVIFPLFGLLFTAAAVGFGIYAYRRAVQYQQAYEAYRARREAVRPEGSR